MRAILMALGLVAAGPAFAGAAVPAPPSPLLNPSQAEAGSRATFARTFIVGTLKGDLGATSLAGFVAQARMGKIERMAGGGAALAWTCYDVGGDRMWLSTTDEMGEKAYVDTITITPRDASTPGTCPSLPSSQKVTVDGVIRIGMTKADLIARLGAPSRQKADWLAYRANPPIKGGGSVFTTLVVRIDGGKVAFIEASNTTAD
jgi:hypothetical protein